MKNDLVTVILVNWNGKKWLKKCLTSLASQSYSSIEIVLIDNGSLDGSVEFVAKNFSFVRIVRNNKNLGYPTAANIGVDVSKGKYLLLINTDTWVDKNFIEGLIKFYKKNKFSVISPVVKNYKDSSVVHLPNIDITGSPAYFLPITRSDKLFYLSSCYFCLKSEYKSTLGFDDNYFAYYEDVDWFWRLNLLKKKFSYAPGIFVYHAGAGVIGNGIKYKMFLYRNQNALQTLLKNYLFLTLIFIIPLYVVQNLIEILFFLLLLKPRIAYSYIEGWIFNIKNLKKIMKKREWIQKRRKVNDWEIMKKMYWGPAKLRMLINYV